MKKHSVTPEENMEAKIPTSLLYIAIGLVAGAVKLSGQWIDKSKRPDTYQEIFIQLTLNCFVSGFAGYMGSIIGSKAINLLLPSPQGEIFVAGIFGYLGVYALDGLSRKYFKTSLQ